MGSLFNSLEAAFTDEDNYSFAKSESAPRPHELSIDVLNYCLYIA